MFQSFLFLLLIAVSFTNLFAQKSLCKASQNLGGKYKIVYGETSVVEGKEIFFLKIKLKPKNFTKEYLLQTAQRIKETYCNEIIINTEIMDGSDKRAFDDLTPPPVFSPATKALYSMNKITGKELIQFVSNDRVVDEIVIKD